jgi:hypothetical protein
VVKKLDDAEARIAIQRKQEAARIEAVKKQQEKSRQDAAMGQAAAELKAKANAQAAYDKGLRDGTIPSDVIFICSTGGSMVDVLPAVKEEVNKRVNALRATQSFDVISSSDAHFWRLSRDRLLKATKENKRDAEKFVETMFVDKATDLWPGLNAAFKESPQGIILITNSKDADDLRAAVAKLNPTQKVRVDVVDFSKPSRFIELNPDPKDIELLRKIAAENKGTYEHPVIQD